MARMSSMVRLSIIALLAGSALTASAPLVANDASEWDNARASMVASQPGPMADAITRWDQLSGIPRFGFDDYAGFVLAYPGFPGEAKLRGFAEGKLQGEAVSPDRVIGFFDRFPPLTNQSRAQYALALLSRGRPEAPDIARAAWHGGEMSETAEASLLAAYGAHFSFDDHDARMDALLWELSTAEAARQLPRTSPDKRAIFAERLIAAQGNRPGILDPQSAAKARSDPGYLFNLIRQIRKSGRIGEAIDMLTNRPALSSLPYDQADWIEELLVNARKGTARQALVIATSADDAFAPGTDVSRLGYSLRDDYTSLMWLGGTEALWTLREPANAAPLFYNYGAAAQTPQTRSKGFYWAGIAAGQAGQSDLSASYLELAAQYPDRFYGMLALEKLGRPIPTLVGEPEIRPDPALRAEFQARPLTKAVREVARDAPWRIGIRFYRELASSAENEAELMLAAELARDIGRRDLAVIIGEEAGKRGYTEFRQIGYPTLTTPPATNWTMVHAITRQESQFAENAISHAGARGLMQLMPGTAREQAGKIGVSYMSASLIDSPSYNIRLGDGYFARMMDYYGGSYPLAVGAYNAGPGNVNKWLRANGDPRTGAVDWLEWLELIPIYETKNYVQRVLENAVVYEQMHPDKAGFGGPRGVSSFIGKRTPG